MVISDCEIAVMQLKSLRKEQNVAFIYSIKWNIFKDKNIAWGYKKQLMTASTVIGT